MLVCALIIYRTSQIFLDPEQSRSTSAVTHQALITTMEPVRVG